MNFGSIWPHQAGLKKNGSKVGNINENFIFNRQATIPSVLGE